MIVRCTSDSDDHIAMRIGSHEIGLSWHTPECGCCFSHWENSYPDEDAYEAYDALDWCKGDLPETDDLRLMRNVCLTINPLEIGNIKAWLDEEAMRQGKRVLVFDIDTAKPYFYFRYGWADDLMQEYIESHTVDGVVSL